MKLGFKYLESVVFFNFTGITAKLEKSVVCTEEKSVQSVYVDGLVNDNISVIILSTM